MLVSLDGVDFAGVDFSLFLKKFFYVVVRSNCLLYDLELLLLNDEGRFDCDVWGCWKVTVFFSDV